MIFIVLLIIITIIIAIVFANRKTEPYSGYYQTREKNEKKNKLIYYQRFDFDLYPEKKDEIYVEVKGANFDKRLEACVACVSDEELMLIRELDNKYDKNAVMVFRFTGDQMGYLPKEDAVKYAELIDEGIPVRAYFSHQAYNEFTDYLEITIYLVEYKKR